MIHSLSFVRVCVMMMRLARPLKPRGPPSTTFDPNIASSDVRNLVHPWRPSSCKAMIVTSVRSLGVRSPYSALSGTQRTRQRKARASQYIISNAETLKSSATVLPYVAPATLLGEFLGVRGGSLVDRVLSPAHRMVTPSPSCPDRPGFREQAARQLPPSAVSSECPDSMPPRSNPMQGRTAQRVRPLRYLSFLRPCEPSVLMRPCRLFKAPRPGIRRWRGTVTRNPSEPRTRAGGRA
ncbi:hypothetical protein LXA43DRAFT_1037500 [Ganoderma leucocontextum]|nr:hypothetical protein LXA43DRAFT_1037500 [Ganoderma leucocontextum]